MDGWLCKHLVSPHVFQRFLRNIICLWCSKLGKKTCSAHESNKSNKVHWSSSLEKGNCYPSSNQHESEKGENNVLPPEMKWVTSFRFPLVFQSDEGRGFFAPGRGRAHLGSMLCYLENPNNAIERKPITCTQWKQKKNASKNMELKVELLEINM